MSAVDFAYQKPTTITMIVPFTGEVNLNAAFSLLPISRIDLPELRRRRQKIKLPHVDIPGAILSLRYIGHTRGIVRSVNSNSFKNSLTIDISTTTKNLCIKLSRGKFHICGASSVEQGEEGCNYIIDKLRDIQSDLAYIEAHPDLTASTVRILKDITKGQEIIRDQSESISLAEDKAYNPVSDYHLKEIKNLEDYVGPDFDLRIAAFLYRQAPDFIYHSHFCADLDYIATLHEVISPDCALGPSQEVMVNINYDLGFNVNRAALCRCVNGRAGFYARYDNTVEHSVTVLLPYDPGEVPQPARKKKGPPCHTFIVYSSGLVTQSSPCWRLMKEPYERFNNLIREIRDEIMIVKPRIIKYTPVYED